MARDGATREEGLRDRKKRLLRERISDTATRMFLERGFDEVTVSEIAAACDVSEKTVFNYFPTKESLLFDREEQMAARISEAARDPGNDVALIDAVLAVLDEDIEEIYRDIGSADDPARMLTMVRQFSALIERTPALAAAMQAMMERLTEVAAEALAERVGVDPDDPEPQMAAHMVLGLWRTQYRAMERHADGNAKVEDVLRAVREDIRRAASVADAGMSAFNLVVRRPGGASGKDQIVQAAQAADHARRQLVAAVKQARDGWRQIVADLQEHHRVDEHGQQTRREQMLRQRELREEIRERRRELRQRQAELRRQQAEVKREQQQAQAELRRQQAEARRQQAEARSKPGG